MYITNCKNLNLPNKYFFEKKKKKIEQTLQFRKSKLHTFDNFANYLVRRERDEN